MQEIHKYLPSAPQMTLFHAQQMASHDGLSSQNLIWVTTKKSLVCDSSLWQLSPVLRLGFSWEWYQHNVLAFEQFDNQGQSEYVLHPLDATLLFVHHVYAKVVIFFMGNGSFYGFIVYSLLFTLLFILFSILKKINLTFI